MMKKIPTLLVTLMSTIGFQMADARAFDCPNTKSIVETHVIENVQKDLSGFRFLFARSKFDTENFWETHALLKANNIDEAKNKFAKEITSIKFLYMSGSPTGDYICAYRSLDNALALYASSFF